MTGRECLSSVSPAGSIIHNVLKLGVPTPTLPRHDTSEPMNVFLKFEVQRKNQTRGKYDRSTLPAVRKKKLKKNEA